MTTKSKRDLTARRVSGAVAAALAAMSVSAFAAQPGYVTSSGDRPVTAAGDCVRTGTWSAGMSGCSPQMAQNTAAGAAAAPARAPSSRSQVAPAGAPSSAAGMSAAGGSGVGVFEDGYVNASNGWNVRDGSGRCVRAGYWTPAMAAEPCDAVARVAAPAPAPAPVAQPAPRPEPAPAPIVVVPPPAPVVVAPAPRGPMIQKITLETDVLFGFDKAELRPEGRQKLDEIADGLKDAKVDEIVAIGHTDPIGSESYNEKLSSRRAEAVKEYLAQRGVAAERIQTEGRGEQNLVTGGDCSKLKGKKLIECFEPNRRVEIEVFGTREVAATGEQPAAGATGPGTGTSGSSGGSGSAR